jgi:hypothetical protein
MAAHIKVKLLVIGKTSGAWLIDALNSTDPGLKSI